jgi:hypothetical protein
MRILSLSLLLLLSACTTTPSGTEEEVDAQIAAEATDHCLANPELAKAWGECNVKKTIFSRMDAIGQCQMKHSKADSKDAMMLKIRLRPNGRVKDVRAEEGKAKNRGLEKCLSSVISKLKFAAPPKGVSPVIYFPFQQQ